MLLLGSIAGFLAVAAGAFGAHALKDAYSAEQMAVYNTAVQYHFWHSLALLGLGAFWRYAGPTRWLVAAATCWVVVAAKPCSRTCSMAAATVPWWIG